MSRVRLRIIGDVHGKVDWNILNKPSYLGQIEGCEYSVQIGDMGNKETYQFLNACIDSSCHKFFPGNHDDYDHLSEHCLGDYGELKHGGIEGFFVRGAFSVDKKVRLRDGIPWWACEELSENVHDDVVEQYTRLEPRLVLSHDCPVSVSEFLVHKKNHRRYGLPEGSIQTKTGELLERLFSISQPKVWVFGHYHEDWHLQINGTEFYCLGELSYLDLDENIDVVSTKLLSQI